MSIRMTRTRKNQYANIEDVDSLMSSQDNNILNTIEEEEEVPKIKKKTIPIKVNNKGKRTIIHLENFIIFIIQSIWHHKNNIEKKTFISFNNICSI